MEKIVFQEQQSPKGRKCIVRRSVSGGIVGKKGQEQEIRSGLTKKMRDPVGPSS